MCKTFFTLRALLVYHYRIFLFFLFKVQVSLLAVELQRENVPLPFEAQQYIRFKIQKDFSDGSLKSEFLQELKSCFGIDMFVETGTQLGNTAEKASEIFSSVHTVELFPEFYHFAQERFKDKTNVYLYFGNSNVVLPSILNQCNRKTLFYLDGHYDGGNTSGKGEKNTPILEELAAIQLWGRSDAVILIDDICDFQQSVYPERIQETCFANYPDLKELIYEILKINSTYQICFIPNALLIFPPNPSVSVSPLLSACTIDWLSTVTSTFSEKEILEAEKTIGSAKGAERKELEDYFHAYADFEYQFGWRSFSGYWMGLILLHEQKFHFADQIFQRTAKHSLPGWRGNPI